MNSFHPTKSMSFKWDETGKQALKFLMNLYNQDI